MTPYKSMLKWVCDRMGAQAHRTHGDFPPLQSMVCYDCRHLLALLCHDPVSRNARHLEKPSSPPPLLACLHASPLPRAENLRRACPLDTGLDHGLALAPRPQGGLLAYPSADSVVGPGSLQHLATAQGRDALSRGGWQCETRAGDAASGSPKGAQKRASALVFWGALRSGDRHVGRLSLAGGLSPDSAQNLSGVPHGKCVVP